MADRNCAIDHNSGSWPAYDAVYSTIAGWTATCDRSNTGGAGGAGNETGTIVESYDFNEAVTLNCTASGTYRQTLTVASGSVHDGTKGSGGETSQTITVSTNYVTVQDLLFDHFTAAVGNYVDLAVIRCFIGSSASAQAVYIRYVNSIEFHNCGFLGSSANNYDGGIRLRELASGDTAIFSYCSLYGSSSYGLTLAACASGSTVTCNGVSSLGPTTPWNKYNSASATLDGDYNLTSAASAGDMPGANSSTSVAAADYYETLTGGSEDLHKKSAQDGSYDGGPSSGLGTHWPGGDVDGDARSDYDIGWDELVSAGGGTILPMMMAQGLFVGGAR